MKRACMQAPGLVCMIWPMIAKEKTDGDEDWTAAFDEVPETAPPHGWRAASPAF